MTSSFWILPGCHKLQAVQLSIPSYAQASAHPRAAAAKGAHGLAAEGLISDVTPRHLAWGTQHGLGWIHMISSLEFQEK